MVLENSQGMLGIGTASITLTLSPGNGPRSCKYTDDLLNIGIAVKKAIDPVPTFALGQRQLSGSYIPVSNSWVLQCPRLAQKAQRTNRARGERPIGATSVKARAPTRIRKSKKRYRTERR
jgi:hypothetical protein